MPGGIGGYLELECCSGEPFHTSAVALNSARSCLAYLIELRGIERIALPDLMCDAVRKTCERMGAQVRTYRIGEGLSLPGDLILGEGEWLYVADYYGKLSAGEVARAKAMSGGHLVVDEVQGFFRDPWPGVDTLYTCRKFFGVADGAYLAAADGARLARELPAGSSCGRMAHVLGRVEAGSAAFYTAYRQAEASIDDEGVTAMSEVTRRLLAAIDYEGVRARREANFAALNAALGGRNLLDPGWSAGPYMYPLLVADAAGVRERLAECGVFVPTLWPNVLEECEPTSWAHKYAENILPLPVDQRYGEEDMGTVAKEVEKCLK